MDQPAHAMKIAPITVLAATSTPSRFALSKVRLKPKYAHSGNVVGLKQIASEAKNTDKFRLGRSLLNEPIVYIQTHFDGGTT